MLGVINQALASTSLFPEQCAAAKVSCHLYSCHKSFVGCEGGTVKPAAESLCKSDKALTSPRTLCCLIPSANPFLTDVCLRQWEGEGCCLLGDALLKVVAGQHQGLPAGAA